MGRQDVVVPRVYGFLHHPWIHGHVTYQRRRPELVLWCSSRPMNHAVWIYVGRWVDGDDLK